MDLQLHTTENAEGFTAAQWTEWDRLLAASTPPSIHLSSACIRAGLRSPKRAVRAARWTDAEGVLKGIAVCEDSQAISQRLDDFLEGSAAFQWARNRLHRAGSFQFKVRVIGQTLASGPHGYRFSEGVDEFAALASLLELPAIGPNKKTPTTWLVKDRPVKQNWGSGVRLAGRSEWENGWVDLEFDPLMRVSLYAWSSWDDYLSGLRTKARTKVNRILKLSESLHFRTLEVADIREQVQALHTLYMNTYDRAAFRLGCLQPEDLVLLKEEMGSRFQLWVAERKGEVIGFHCGMCDGQEVEAFFVGFGLEHNKSFALYQRMLIEFIRWGLKEGCSMVNLGRTALDLKASLGAQPQRLVLHERIQNPIVHRLAQWAARASTPRQEPLKRARK